MGRVRTVAGEEVLTEEEFATWWEEHHLQRDSFVNARRRRVAGQMQIRNFRRLALICGEQVLGAESPWMDAEMVAVVRTYSTDGQDDLLRAARKGEMSKVVSLLETPYDPNLEASDGSTALHYATVRGSEFMVRCLVEAGADKDKADLRGYTPMHVAALTGRGYIVRCLMEAGADMDKADDNGETPMHVAVTRGHAMIVCYLLEAGADRNKANNLGATPLDVAFESGHEDIAQRLLAGSFPPRHPGPRKAGGWRKGGAQRRNLRPWEVACQHKALCHFVSFFAG
ncbi:unnamed protein product, partial [Effrenium voratum]